MAGKENPSNSREADIYTEKPITTMLCQWEDMVFRCEAKFHINRKKGMETDEPVKDLPYEIHLTIPWKECSFTFTLKTIPDDVTKIMGLLEGIVKTRPLVVKVVRAVRQRSEGTQARLIALKKKSLAIL